MNKHLILAILFSFLFLTRFAFAETFGTPPRKRVVMQPSIDSVAVVSEKKNQLVMLVNLLGHFRVDVKHCLVNSIGNGDVEEISKSDFVFFISDNDGKIPSNILNLMVHRKKGFCFVGNDLYVLLRRVRYPISYNGEISSYSYINYRGRRYFNDGRSAFFSSYSMNGGKVLSYFTDGTNRAVYIGKMGNMWFVTNPALYGYSIPGLIFADALHDILKREHTRVLGALIRLEDINPSYDDKVLEKTLSYLYRNHLPFAMIFYLVYVDFADKEVITISQRPDLVRILKKADRRGGTLILHGVTHQYRKVEISGEGSEFWDMERNAMIPNFKKYFDERMRYAIMVSKKYGIPFRAFEAPHYNLPLVGQEMLKKYFPVYVGQAMVNNDNYRVTQQFPYFIYRSYAGLFIVPENLGYVAIHEEEKGVGSILSRARLLKEIVRDPVAAFFFHPFVGVKYLREVVEGLENMGYNFVDLKNVIPLYEMPDVKAVSIKNIGLPFDISKVEKKKGKLDLRILVLGIFLTVVVLSVAYIFRLYRNRRNRWE
ncbi:MAG: DUF2334 domain-containing protein [Synergistetes bacterium]|nr:DUF2334 domain-containing protein [Synergistota bacterium]